MREPRVAIVVCALMSGIGCHTLVGYEDSVEGAKDASAPLEAAAGAGGTLGQGGYAGVGGSGGISGKDASTEGEASVGGAAGSSGSDASHVPEAGKGGSAGTQDAGEEQGAAGDSSTGGTAGAAGGSGGAAGVAGVGGAAGSGGSSGWAGSAGSGGAIVVQGWPDSETVLCSDGSVASAACPGVGQDYHGQDGNDWVVRPEYDVGADTVVDRVTGLEWQRVPAAGLSWQLASTYCPNLDLLGKGWRLPSALELSSLLDCGKAAPALDTEAFEAAAGKYWSATAVVSPASPASQWAVTFAVPYSVEGNATTGLGNVRCVRGTAVVPSLQAAGTNTAVDATTKLEWQRGEAGPLSWKAALAHCEGLEEAGLKDWRLPTLKELLTIIDHSKTTKPAVDTTLFPSQTYARYWTSTPLAPSGIYEADAAVSVAIEYGISSFDAMTTANRVRCVRGGAGPQASCAALQSDCGPASQESCCARSLIPGGEFNRSNEAGSPATVSPFLLDRFEVTVGRFRSFVEAWPGSKPLPGSGAHPRVAGSGWQASWDAAIPADKASLEAALKQLPNSAWTDTPDVRERHPINSVSWYLAFAFCAWDGGRLPTEAEWNFAAAAGSQQRVYPWSGTTIDSTFANYNCAADGIPKPNCSLADMLAVGSRSPKGDGYWGQADLAGNAFEWVFDYYGMSYDVPCQDCAHLINDGLNDRVLRGGSSTEDPSWLQTGHRSAASNVYWDRGMRCARDR